MITEGHLARHYQGRRGGRGPAIIDIAQDHLLAHLASQGLFDLGVALKGGTSIRKFRAGNQGRFSTDLDFAGLDDSGAELLLECVDGATVGPFKFSVEPIDGTMRAKLGITSPFGNADDIPARLDLGRRPLWLPPERMPILALPIHRTYEVELPLIPVAQQEEVMAEKLARFRRRALGRDLYDLAWFSNRPFEEWLVREMTVLKVWSDVVEEGLGEGPFDPEDILRHRDPDEFEPEAIGYLTRPVDMREWIALVRERFRFLRELDDGQRLICRCSRGDKWLVHERIGAVAAPETPPA